MFPPPLLLVASAVLVVGCTKPEPAATAPPAPPVESTIGPLRLLVSKAEVLAALRSQGFQLLAEDAENQAFNLSRYRVAESSASILFIEQGNELDTISVTMQRKGPKSDGARAVDCAALILATVTATTTEQARQAIGETITTLGAEATDPQRIVGMQTPRASVRAVRSGAGDITLIIGPSLNRNPTTPTSRKPSASKQQPDELKKAIAE